MTLTAAQTCGDCRFATDGNDWAAATPADWVIPLCPGRCNNCGTCGVGRIRFDGNGVCDDDPVLSDRCDVVESADFYGQCSGTGDGGEDCNAVFQAAGTFLADTCPAGCTFATAGVDRDYCSCSGDSQCNEACPNFDASQPVTTERIWGRRSEAECQDSRTCESTQDLCSNGCCGGPFGGCPDGCTGSSVQTINGQRSCTCTGCPTGPQVDVHDVPNLDVLTASNPIFCASDYSQVLLDLGWCTSCDTCTSLQGDIVRPPLPLPCTANR